MTASPARPLAVSAGLADFVAATGWEDLPEVVRHAAKRALLNVIAVAAAGSHDRALEIALATLGSFSGKAEASLIGRPERVDAALASFLNAAAANLHDFDDTHLRTIIHPTAPVAPALLALAEGRRIAGRDLVLALALGIEVACRIGNAVSPEHYRRGWHITATCGVFGAALAVGKLLGLDRERLVWALGTASAQSGGLVETLGFMAKSFGVGSAARNGLLAALLAERGFDGPALPLEGPRGFFPVLGEAARLEEVLEGLGARWEILENYEKPYPCGVVLNAVIDGCLALRAEPGFRAEAVRRVTLYGHPLLRQRADRPDVTTGREAQVSAQHAVAACLLWGEAGLGQFSDAAVADPTLLPLKRAVEIVDTEGVPVGGLRILVAFEDGSSRSTTVERARGTDGAPLSDAELEEKLRRLVAWGAPELASRSDAVIEAVWGLDRAEDAGSLMALLRSA